MLMIDTYVSHSPIQGFGVFAAEPVAQGHMLWLLNPKFDVFIAESEIETLPPHMRHYLARYAYPHMDRPGVLVLDSDNGKFMNHSEMPNTDFCIFDRGFAIEDIAAGEEITCNYFEFDPTFKGFFAGTEALAAPSNGNGAAALR